MGFDRPSRPWALALLLGVVPAPPQDDLPTGMVTGLRARHEAGQTILTWREVDPPVTAESIPVAELRRIRSALDRGRKVRYRICRSGQPIDQESIKGLQPIAEVPPSPAGTPITPGSTASPSTRPCDTWSRKEKGPSPRDSCTADLTPRRLQRLRRRAGEAFRWTRASLKDGREVQSGTAEADARGLLTLREVRISKAKGRVRIVRP